MMYNQTSNVLEKFQDHLKKMTREDSPPSSSQDGGAARRERSTVEGTATQN